MRLLFVNDQVLPSPETDTEQMLNTVSALGRAGAKVRLLLPRKRGAAGPSLSELCGYYEVLPSFEVVTTPSLFPASRLVEKPAHAGAALLNPSLPWADVVFTRNIPTLLMILLLSSKPVVYETYRAWPDQHPVLGPFFRRLGRSPRLVGAVVHSEYAARSFAGAGFPAEKILVARNGHDPRRMDPVLSREEARERLGLPLEGAMAVYAGHLSARKGSEALLDLAASLPEVRFLLVGATDRKGIGERADSLENVTLVGWCSKREAVLYLYAGDVLIIPPTAGPLKKVGKTVLPLKTYLYLAAGRPILAPDTPDLREVLTRDRNAVLVNPDDVPAAARAMRELLSDPEKMGRLAAAARESAAGLTYARRAEEILRFTKARLGAFDEPA
jgi:glycosyltransferase involved in cell wall biosynthesis